MKKGQVTIFIIISIFIVGAAAVFIFNNPLTLTEIPPNIEPFSNHFFSCLKDVSNDGVYFVASHGGYFNPPENSIIYFDEGFPYYYLESKEYIPSINNIENELEEYISLNLENCLNEEDFVESGFEINKKEYKFLVNINSKSINAKLISSLSVKKGEDTIILKDNENTLDYNFIRFHKASIEIVESYSKKPGLVCLTCLNDISIRNNVEIEAQPVSDVSEFKNNIIWFVITDKEDLSENKLTWRFVVEK